MSDILDAERDEQVRSGVRTFNVAGPCRASRNYMLAPLERLPEAIELVEQEHYFVVHAPRQTGKTTTLEAIAHELTRTGRYAALAFSCQSAGAAGEDTDMAQQQLLEKIRHRAALDLPAELRPPEEHAEGALSLERSLTLWARACPRPLVLFFDEIDSLVGRSLVRVLSELRTGHARRPDAFPASIAVCGLRDVRDGGGSGSGGMDTAKAASGGDPSRLGSGSPFNVVVESFRLGDFSMRDIAELYGQHTAATGQAFTEEAIDAAYDMTRGQPWLVNALAREVVEKLGVPADEPIGPDHLEAARRRLIEQRPSHLDSLVNRLTERRVQRVIEPVITGELLDAERIYDDDIRYSRDLGLISEARPLQVANPIYREVILRALSSRFEERMPPVDPRPFVDSRGRLDFEALLDEFVGFWKQYGDRLINQQTYNEAAAQLLVLGFLYRVVSDGGVVDEEYGVGRGRVDLCVRWPYLDEDGKRALQCEALEVKVWRDQKSDPWGEGIGQLDEYLDRLDLRRGTLLIFDRRRDAAPLPDRVSIRAEHSAAGRLITIIRL